MAAETKEKAETETTKQIGKDKAVPELDLAFGYYWEEKAGEDPKFHVFHGQPAIFRRALADALLNPRLKRLYFAVNGVWVEMPLGSDPSLR